MKNLIKKILKESFDDFNWVGEYVKEFTPAEEFLYELMSNLTREDLKYHPNLVGYKDESGKFLMVDNINLDNNKYPFLDVDQNEIWEKLKNDFGLTHDEIVNLCITMLAMTHKRKVKKVYPSKLINDWVTTKPTPMNKK